MCCGKEVSLRMVLQSAKYLSQRSNLRAKVSLAFSHPPVSGPLSPRKLFLNSPLSGCYGLNLTVPKRLKEKALSQRGGTTCEKQGLFEGSCVTGGCPSPLFTSEALPGQVNSCFHHKLLKMLCLKARRPSHCLLETSHGKPESISSTVNGNRSSLGSSG